MGMLPVGPSRNRLEWEPAERSISLWARPKWDLACIGLGLSGGRDAGALDASMPTWSIAMLPPLVAAARAILPADVVIQVWSTLRVPLEYGRVPQSTRDRAPLVPI